MQIRSESVEAMAPAVYEVLGGFRPRWVLELESGIEQAPRHHSPALEHQFRFGAQKHGAQLDERSGRGEAVGDAALLAQNGHELTVRKRMRCGHVDRARDVVPGNQELDCPGKI